MNKPLPFFSASKHLRSVFGRESPQRASSGWLCILCALLLPALAGADDLADLLSTHRDSLELSAGRLHGSGAETLLERARSAQFILIGEDHGFADVPEFAAALQRSLGDQAPANLVLEVGPYSAQRVESALRLGRKQLSALNRDYPFALPFLNLRDDGDLAAQFVDGADCNGCARLWGIDQEFVLSPSLHLQTLKAAAVDEASHKLVDTWTTRANAAYQTMVEQHDPSKMPLLAFTSEDFAELAKHFSGTDQAEARKLIDALAHSAQIYRDQSSNPYASNLARAQLMKRQFMAAYRAAPGDKRALFKLGAYHAGRGRSPTGIFDIGNLASELAESNGSHSLHILVLAGGGTVNRWLPFLPDDSARSQAYAAADELASIGAGPLLDASQRDAISVFNCTSLRQAGVPKTAAALRELIFAYDWIVILPNARAASNDA